MEVRTNNKCKHSYNGGNISENQGKKEKMMTAGFDHTVHFSSKSPALYRPQNQQRSQVCQSLTLLNGPKRTDKSSGKLLSYLTEGITYLVHKLLYSMPSFPINSPRKSICAVKCRLYCDNIFIELFKTINIHHLLQRRLSCGSVPM